MYSLNRKKNNLEKKCYKRRSLLIIGEKDGKKEMQGKSPKANAIRGVP